ncbi:hypothetical protein K7X08_022980 [Anisodus acutangulus]|uniref:Cyanobacterial aminoacyl-tRNA synthetase CAAD domain-containing protein n=1 Tax=Anisodus acutangulus TaxID=402998 RepID=A0A9Q1RHN9_9SOLA|nr:hypothetical protein K7X08_022980 [Anisodus acutangulus]
MAAIAAASTSIAATALFTTLKAAPFSCSALPYLLPPRVSSTPFSTSFKFSESKRSSLLQAKASSSEETSVDTNEFLTELKEKWDAVEDKSTVLLYGGGAIVAIWLSSIVVGAINSVPLSWSWYLVGLGYTGWFVYRYLLFKLSRKELAEDVEELKKKIAGT